ncbi:hypothetical protein BDW71DRAFT_183586 [Aspergillus fruticulosus]
MEFVQTDTLSVQDLLRSGKPFVPFSEFSIQALLAKPDEDAYRWIADKLRDGRPFVIRGFAQTDAWRTASLSNESLVKLSASGAIPVRNCQTGRDVGMRLRDLSHSSHASAAGVQESLYAKDLHCPEEWVRAFETILPSSLRHLGPLDLFRALPEETTPEVLMAYVGTRMSFSGFHRCFSATVALNLLIESEGNGLGSICFGTDRNSQERYDVFMEGLGKSAHTDWTNVSVNKLISADFPIYITEQGPGDLVVFPAATAHQVWNVSPMVTKVVWNIMHATSVASFFDYVQPAYQKQCHADTGRVSLIPMYALQSGACESEEESLLLNIFNQQVEDEITGRESSNSLGVANHLTNGDHAAQKSLLSIKTVDTQGAVVECNFCGLTIWNRHLHCEKCGDFDLCLTCFVSGRSCKHTTDYTWAEILPQERCQDIIKVTRSRLGLQNSQLSRPSKQKSLGLVAAAAMGARQQSAERLCHLCRDSHPAWKGTTCSQCSAFFCFRGLHRHFDVDLIPFLKNPEDWICPKCEQVCNCRCCHFRQPYQSKDKPGRVRVKSIDARGRILGFVDNVFDQKRGKRASQAISSTFSQPQHSPRRAKRSKLHTDEDSRQSWPHTRSCAVVSAEPSQTRRLGISHSPSINIPTPVGNNLHDSSTRAFNPLAPFCCENQVVPAPEGHSARYAYLHPPTLTATPDESVSRRHIERNRNGGDAPDNESIQELENKLTALRGYADDVLELSLVESHARILDRISQVEAEIEWQKRRKAELLLSRLNRDFPELADLAREEARRRGL